MRKILFLTMCLCLMAAPAWAVSVNFNDGLDHGNQGASLTFGDLTLTAKSGLPDTATNPLTTSLYPGTVYWGKLGQMDGDGTIPNYFGLGVQNASAGGSAGISGAGKDGFEALVFSFTSNPVVASSVILTLNGLNSAGKNADSIALWLNFSGTKIGVTFGQLNDAGNGTLGDGISTLAFNQFSATTGQNFGSFAVEADAGHFGVQDITYNPVPLPPAVLLLGSGLLGLIGLGWRRRKTNT